MNLLPPEFTDAVENLSLSLERQAIALEQVAGSQLRVAEALERIDDKLTKVFGKYGDHEVIRTADLAGGASF